MFLVSTSTTFVFFALTIDISAIVFTSPNTFHFNDKFIILLKSNADMTKHIHSISTQAMGTNNNMTLNITRTYAIGDFKAYSGHMSSSFVEQLRLHKDVASIEAIKALLDPHIEDTPCEVEACRTERKNTSPRYDLNKPPRSLEVQNCAPVNLGLISHKRNDDTKTYWYKKSAGGGTFAYIIDSGIEASHIEFENRASLGFNAGGQSVPDRDEASRGTYYASIIGGRQYGVAKRTSLIGVKVTQDGAATMTSILDGFQWAINDITSKHRQRKAVILTRFFSFDASAPFNGIVAEAYKQGIVTVISAGDHDDEASKTSPASGGKAIVVGATDGQRVRKVPSNFGKTVNMWAPGDRVCGASSEGHDTTMQFSGTTAAAAHVAGLVVYLQGSMDLPNPEATKEALSKLALVGVVKDRKGATNLFAYNRSGK